MKTFLSIALLVYLVMSVISVGYSIWWLSIVAKEMRKTNKTINEINNTQIKGQRVLFTDSLPFYAKFTCAYMRGKGSLIETAI